MNKDELQTLKALMRGEIERKVGYPLQSGPDLARSGAEISGEVGGRKIESSTLEPGVEFDITWAPDRTLSVRYLGDGNFEILRSVNSKLVAGRTFRAPYIIEGMPMLLEDYRPTADADPIIYEIGRSGGVTLSL